MPYDETLVRCGLAELRDLAKTQPESAEEAQLREEQLESAFSALAAIINELDHEDACVVEHGLLNKLSHRQLGALLLAFPITEPITSADGKPNRHLAVDVADHLGPDWAQAWYRFVVLVTKLA